MKFVFFHTFLMLFILDAYSQNDASLTYIDLVAKCNQNIIENRNQKVINWDEVPIELEGVMSMKETSYYKQYDDSIKPDTIIKIGSMSNEATKSYVSTYTYTTDKNDSLKITLDSMFGTQVSYKGRIISNEDEGSKMNYDYYKTGELKQLIINGKPLLESNRKEDTIFYKLNYFDIVSGNIISKDNVPHISIQCIKSKEGCYEYKNIFEHKKMPNTPVVNKHFIICKDGNMSNLMILDRYSNYNKIQVDYEFLYENGILIERNCKPTAQYPDFNNTDYKYDANGNLVKIIGDVITTALTYDHRNNIIQRIDYMTASQALNKLWIREIEYVD